MTNVASRVAGGRLPSLIRYAGTTTKQPFPTEVTMVRAGNDTSRSLKTLEGLFEVGDDVLRVLYPDGEPHEVLPDPEPLAARG